MYATFLGQGGVGGPIRLAYSADGGNTWTVNTLNPNSDLGAGDVTSNVNATGQGWAAWTDNGSVYAQSFQAADAIPRIVSAPGAAANRNLDFTDGGRDSRRVDRGDGRHRWRDRSSDDQRRERRLSRAGLSTTASTPIPTCTATSKVLESTAAVTAGKAAASAPITAALAAGNYYWQATYSGDANNQPSRARAALRC